MVVRLKIFIGLVALATLIYAVNLISVRGNIQKSARRIHLLLEDWQEVKNEISELRVERARLSTPAMLSAKAKEFQLPVQPPVDPALLGER